MTGEAAHWTSAVRRPEIDAAIRAIYLDAGREIELARPICLTSGHCCRFGEYGHDLFVTGLETAWFLRELERQPPLPPAASTALPLLPGASSAVPSVDSDRVCPWLVGRLCGARAARPLGCRTFFCDRRRSEWSENLHERLHARIRSTHDEFGIVYRYGEWLRMLNLFAATLPTRCCHP